MASTSGCDSLNARRLFDCRFSFVFTSMAKTLFDFCTRKPSNRVPDIDKTRVLCVLVIKIISLDNQAMNMGAVPAVLRCISGSERLTSLFPILMPSA